MTILLGFSRSISCVKHAEEAALQRHSTWSAMAVDLVLGNLIGLGLLFNTESVCSFVFDFAKEFTNGILRSGSVWLMGVPAGFKLNTELAGVLGMVSLNVIQIWSTLWFDKSNCHPWNYFWCHSICRICHRCHYFCNTSYNGSSLGNHTCVFSPNPSLSSFVEAFQVNLEY